MALIKNVLIAGGAGFIGSHLALKLVERGYHVTVLDNLSPQIHGINPDETSCSYQSIKGHVIFKKGSVSSRQDWMLVLKGQDAVINMAAETGTGQSMYDISNYVDVNIGGTALLLDILANTKHTIKKVIVAESRAIYGEGKYYCRNCGDVYPNHRREEHIDQGDFECHCPKCGRPVKLVATTEDSLIHPSSVYGITKQVQGELVHLVCKSLGIDSVSFRYQNVYGPGQSLYNPYTGILSIFSTRILNHHPINVFEDGMESRDFVYIDDVVDATIMGLDSSNANGHAINIGSGVSTTVLKVAQVLCKAYGIKVPIHISGDYRIGDIRHNYADITLAGRILGYIPKWSFESGIAAFSEWVKQQRVEEDRYDVSIEEMKAKGLYRDGK